MFTKDLMLAAKDSATILSDRGIRLQPKSNTDLHRLVENMLPACGCLISEDSDVSYEDQIYEHVTSCLSENSDSQAMMTVREMADVYAPLVQQQIYHARSVVVPLVKELEEKINSFLTAMQSEDVSTNFVINQHGVPAIVKDDSFMDGYVDKALEDDFLSLQYWVPYTASDWVAIKDNVCSLGSIRRNELFEKWCSGAMHDCLRRVFIANFTTSDITGEAIGYLLDDDCVLYDENGDRTNTDQASSIINKYAITEKLLQNCDLMKAIDLLIAAVIISNTLIDKPISQELNTSGRDKVVSNKQVYSTLLRKAVNQAIVLENNDVLVISQDKGSKTINVNKEVYLKWLQDGNCPEILFGGMIGGTGGYGLDVYVQNKDRYLKIWEDYVTITKQSNDLTKLSALKDFIISAVQGSLIEGISDSEKEYRASINVRNDVGNQNVLDSVKVELDNLDRLVLTDPAGSALRIVAKCRFGYTSAFKILSTIEAMCKDNDNLEPRAAASIAVLSYIVEYFLTRVNHGVS